MGQLRSGDELDYPLPRGDPPELCPPDEWLLDERLLEDSLLEDEELLREDESFLDGE